jgi:Xaa-Pro dipeptidase
VFENLKPGADWKDLHLLAERVTLTGLKELGLISGDVDEMLEGRLGFIF